MNFLKNIFRSNGTVGYGLENYDSNFDPKPKWNWRKAYNVMIIIGNTLFVLMMVSWFLKWLFHF